MMKRSILALFLSLSAMPGWAQSSQVDATLIVKTWVAAFANADRDAIAASLDPVFQIQRASGTGHTRDDYLINGLPRVAADPAPEVTDVIASQDGDILVVRYALLINALNEDGLLTRHAPRLTVFRRAGNGDWLAVAHANFAPPTIED